MTSERNTVVALGELRLWAGMDYPATDITYPAENDTDTPMRIADGLMDGDDPLPPGTPVLVVALPGVAPHIVAAIVSEVQRIRFTLGTEMPT